MKHLLQISDLSCHDVEQLLERALFFKHSMDVPIYKKHTVAHLFYENSTRTRVSFELAAKNLSMNVVNLDVHTSAEQKGEVIEDTIKTLASMGVSMVVIRHQQDKLPLALAKSIQDEVHIINAGDGRHAHPSQALLDIMTILAHKPRLDRLKIAIVGDVYHSRVANSFQALCSLLGVGELVMVAPKIWQPKTVLFGQVSDSLKEGLKDADVVMCLRVQRERLSQLEHIDETFYRTHFAITAQSLSHARPDAIVMHPGPINRGIEIDDVMADGAQSVIRQQVSHGVYMRMAILESLCQ